MRRGVEIQVAMPTSYLLSGQTSSNAVWSSRAARVSNADLYVQLAWDDGHQVL
jgi:hypothetical protein